MSLPTLLGNGRWRCLLAVSALTFAQGLAAGMAAFATRGLFAALHGPDPLPHGLLAMLAASGLFIALARIATRVAGEHLGQAYARDIRITLFEHAAGMSASDVAARRGGYMSLRFVGDMTAFRDWLGLGLPRLIAGIILIPLALGVLWLLEPVFVWSTLPLLLFALGVMALGGVSLPRLHRRLRTRRARIAAEMAERMPLAPDLDRLGRRRAERRHLERLVERMVRGAVARIRMAESLKAVPDAMAGIAAMLVIYAGARAGTDAGTIAGGLAALGLMLAPMRDLASVWNLWSAWSMAAFKAEAALARRQRETYADSKSLPSGAAAIAISGLDLPSGAQLDFDLAPGSAAMLNLTDDDASYLMNALQGLEAVPEDRIRLSGICLRRLSRGSLRRGVVAIGTEPPILQGSLRRVLTLGVSRRPDDERLSALARRAGLGAALARLGGLDGTVREGGRNLSRSEKAAVSLVRARQQRPRLILIDETIAALSGAQRRRIEDWYERSGATVLVCRSADRVQNRVVPATIA